MTWTDPGATYAGRITKTKYTKDNSDSLTHPQQLQVICAAKRQVPHYHLKQ